MQGKAESLKNGWVNVLNLMQSKKNVVAFLLSYDKELRCEDEVPNVVCLFSQSTTWTSGRNLIARAMFEYERSTSSLFKYWLLADSDMANLHTCHKSTKCPESFAASTAEMSACCYDIAVKTLISKTVHHPVISFLQAKVEKATLSSHHLGFCHIDCSDAALTAFHRDAVSVTLPYVQLLDQRSWWESQGMLFHVLAGCLRGRGVIFNLMDLGGNVEEHVAYPRGRRPEESPVALRQVYAKLGLIPHPMNSTDLLMEQGNCGNVEFEKVGLLSNGYEPNGEDGWWNTDDWTTDPTFVQCKAALSPRFDTYMSSGDIFLTDGEAMPKIVVEVQPNNVEDIRKCKDWYAQYNVVPGMSWGQLPLNLHDEWILLLCDQLILK